MLNNKAVKLLLVLLVVVIILAGFTNRQANKLEQEMVELRAEIEAQELRLEMTRQLLDEMHYLIDRQEELYYLLLDWLSVWEVDELEVTGYTLECGYPWDDGITYLGYEATPGRTLAVDPDVIPLDSWVLVEGLGMFRAEDVGAAVKGNVIDVYFGEGQEAYNLAMAHGRQELKVVYLNGEAKNY